MLSTVQKRPEGQIRVATIGEGKCTLESYNRRDFYKISLLLRGKPAQLHYGSLPEIEVDRPAIVLVNPITPYSWTGGGTAEESAGYFCVFNEEFIRSSAQLSGVADRLYSNQQSPVYFLDKTQEQFLTGVFARMRREVDVDYSYKEDFFRSHLSVIFHEAIQMQPAPKPDGNAISRITREFFQLLSKQFPVDLPLQPIALKKPADFACRIAVHVNHLNAAVQKVSGKSTTLHINERLFAEAKSLLSYTSYSVAEISEGLGFEYQTYFNRFFKKHAGLTPGDYRKNFEKYK